MAITVQQVRKFNKKLLDPRTLNLFEICAQGYLDREAGDTNVLQRSYEFAVDNLDRIINEDYRVPEPEARRAKTVTPKPAKAEAKAPQPTAQTATRQTANPATDAQTRYISNLMSQRDTSDRGKVNLPQLLLDRHAEGTLSKRQASELIDWLKEQPVKTAETAAQPVARPVGRQATDKQVAALVREGARRRYDDEATAQTVALAEAGEPVGFGQASAALDILFDSPFQSRPKQNDLPDGFYVRDSEVYKVIVAVHGSGNKYAKKLDQTTGEWEMASGAIAKLTTDHAMSLDQALRVAKVVATDVDGRLYGRCFMCSTILTDERSIADGLGPVCSGKLR